MAPKKFEENNGTVNNNNGFSNNNHEPDSISVTLPVPKNRCPPVRESQILLWIWKVMEEISSFDFEQYLRDGVVLCKLIETLTEHSKSDYDAGTNKKVKGENIERFLSACRAYGVPEEDLFQVEDLLSMQDLGRVTQCLFSLGEIAATKYGTPQLGVAYDQWIEQQLQDLRSIKLEPNNRRAGMPIGDDLYVSHVSTSWLKDKLAVCKERDANNIRKPPADALINRKPSKPVSEIRSLFVQN